MNYYIDLDGTIINSTKRHAILLNHILLDMNLKTVEEKELLDYKASGGNTFSYLTNIKKIDEKTTRIIVDKWQENIEDENYLKYDIIYDDSIKFLDYISKNIYSKIYILTARQNKENLINQILEFDLMKYLEDILIVSPVNAIEEKKQCIIDTKDNNNSMIFGDSEVDYQVAEHLKIDYFILNRGFRNKKYWDSMNIKSHESLLDYLEEKND